MTMNISKSALMNIILATVLVTSLFFTAVGTTASRISNKTASAGEYDPWLDNTGDGYIGVDDIFNTAQSFGAEGDATKNVNVTNWQISRDVSVWWVEDVVPGGLVSPPYSTGGFGHLHVLIVGSSLSGAETLAVNIRGRLYNGTRSSWLAVTAYTATVTSSANTADISISVPSDTFYFTVPYDAASTCSISLSFYLTWA